MWFARCENFEAVGLVKIGRPVAAESSGTFPREAARPQVLQGPQATLVLPEAMSGDGFRVVENGLSRGY